MTEQTNVMQDALVSIIQKTQQGIDASVSFLSEQIPDVIQQLLMWQFAKNCLAVLLASVLPFLFVYFFKKVVEEEKNHPYGGPLAPYCIIGGFVSAASLLFAIRCLFEALQIYIAPKVYLIEYAASLVK